jgi:hypothetical protein
MGSSGSSMGSSSIGSSGGGQVRRAAGAEVHKVLLPARKEARAMAAHPGRPACPAGRRACPADPPHRPARRAARRRQQLGQLLRKQVPQGITTNDRRRSDSGSDIAARIFLWVRDRGIAKDAPGGIAVPDYAVRKRPRMDVAA